MMTASQLLQVAGLLQQHRVQSLCHQLRLVTRVLRQQDHRHADVLRTWASAQLVHDLEPGHAVQLQAGPDARAIRHIVVRPLNGKSYTVQAGHYVLACGAIENARLLLASNDVEKSGVGNGNDQVGRYFMEHPCGRSNADSGDPDRRVTAGGG